VELIHKSVSALTGRSLSLLPSATTPREEKFLLRPLLGFRVVFVLQNDIDRELQQQTTLTI
jgi:hypothetical protein